MTTENKSVSPSYRIARPSFCTASDDKLRAQALLAQEPQAKGFIVRAAIARQTASGQGFAIFNNVDLG